MMISFITRREAMGAMTSTKEVYRSPRPSTLEGILCADPESRCLQTETCARSRSRPETVQKAVLMTWVGERVRGRAVFRLSTFGCW